MQNTYNTQRIHVSGNFTDSVYDVIIGALLDQNIHLFDYEESIDEDAVRLHFEDDRNDCAVFVPYEGTAEVLYFSEGTRKGFKRAVNKALWAYNEPTRTAEAREATREDWPIDPVMALVEPLFAELETELKLEVDGCDGGWDSAYAALSNNDLNLKVRWSLDVAKGTRLCSITWEIQASDTRLLILAGAHRDRINATIELYNTRMRLTRGRRAYA